MLLTRSRRCGRTSCHQFHRSRTKMADDPIKAFLETSGLTPEDLIRRLAQYQNNSDTVLEEIVEVKREPSSPVHTPDAFTETILISDSEDEDDDGSRREPERIEICESDDEVVENKSKVEESDSGRLKRRLSEVEDAVPKKSRRRSEEDKFELYEGKDLDTFILKNRLGDIFEDSSPRGRVSTDLVSNETGESEVVGNSASIDESTKSASPSQDLDSVNKIVTQVDEQNPQKTCKEEGCTISEVRCEAGEATQNEKCTVNETKCNPGISKLNRSQEEISKAADEVIDLDDRTSKTNDLPEEADVTVTTKESRNDNFIDLDQMTIKTNDLPEEGNVTVATKESRNNYSEKSKNNETTIKTNDLLKEADVNLATEESQNDSEKIDVTEEIEAVKEDEDSSCLDNVLDSLLHFVDNDDSGERTKVTSDDVETTGQSSSNIIEKDVLRTKIDEEVVQKDKDLGLYECTRLVVQKETEVESIVDKETITSVDLVDKEVVQKDQNESANVKMDVLIDKCVDVALEHENLDSSNLHLGKNPQKIVDLTVSSDSSDLDVEKDEDLPSKDGLFNDKSDEPRKVEAATVSSHAFGDMDSLKDEPKELDTGKIKDSSDLDVFEDTKVAPELSGGSHKDKYMEVDLKKVEDTTASSNLNVFQHTNNDGEVDLNSCTQKIDETSSTSSDLDVFGDVLDRIRKVDSLKDDGSSSSNSDLHNLVKEGDSSTDSSGDGDVFEKQYRARLKDPRILRREIEKYDAWCTENAKFDKFSFIKSDFEEGEASTEIIDVDKVECNGKPDDSEDVELITKDVEVIDVDEIEEKSDGTAGRSDDPGEFVKLEVEEDAMERTEDDGSNVKDFHDDINDGSKTELSGRSSPSLSTLELNSDISDVDVDVENNRVEAESSAGYVDETVDLTFDHHSTEKKLPTVGTIRKSVGKRTARVFRPPWLKADDADEQDVASDVAEPQVELRPKPLGPLVDIRTSIPEMYHKRRTKTPEPPAEPSLFDIKIVDVKSGADVDIRTAIAQIRDRRRRDDVINEELKGDVITLTKTSDFTKIKGWRRKKLLIKSETDIDVDYGEVDNVFASDNLDGFLDRQKNLNISYNVPNLKSSNHSNVDYLDGTVIMHDSSADEKGRFESRRRFTMAENEQVSCINQNAKTDPFKPRTLAEKRKLLSREIKPEPPTSHSLVYYRGKAFKVPSKYEKNITVHGENRTKYRYTYTSAKPPKKTKPSIYTTNLSRTVAIKYKPGPMSKKQVLDSNWTPVVKKLPRIRLCVVPEYRAPLHPRAAQFVKFETFEVTSERVEFALGALPGKGVGTCFEVPYKNDQKTVLLLKAAEVVAPEVKPEPPQVKVEEENVEDVVRKMLGDMVDYVELKEVGESIVEEDHSYEPQAKETSPTKPGAKRSSRTEVIKGSTKKTNLELKRLNVKIIEVNIEDGADDGVGCTKSHCRLGCVCKSLRAPVFPQDHCGKRQCIFGCVCGFERSRNRRMKFVLPSGTDILSETTVSRLQDEAKKNLAKVEKEFTQTVIHANNQTIVVGEKTDRKRRPLKTPKKYEDYIEPVVLGEEDQPQEAIVSPMKPIVVELPRKRKRSPPPPETTVIPCRVVVHKLDLEHVLPLCLEHNLYDCHCGGRDSYSKTTTLASLVRPTPSARPTPSTTPVDEGKEVGEKAERKKVIREKREKDSDWCSRTKGAPYSIVQRNRTGKYKKTLAHKLRRSENADAHSLDISARWLKDPVDDVVEQIAIDNNAVCKDEPENGGTRGRKKKRRKMPELIPIKEDTTAQIDQDPLLEPLGTGSLESTKPSRRKQVLMTREQMGEMMKKKAVEEKAKAKAAKWKALCEPQPQQQPPKQPPKPQQQQVLGEAVVPLHSDLNQKVKDLLGNSNDVLRIIPWRLLLQKYLSGTIEIWCWPAFQKFVLTDPKVFLTKAWLNVRQHEKDAGTCEMRDLDFFKWIVDRRTNDESQSVFIILQKTSACWEVRGVVRKSGAGSSVLKSSRPETTTISPTNQTPTAEAETTESSQPATNQPPPTKIEPEKTESETTIESETTDSATSTELATTQSPLTADEVARKTQEYVGEANQQYKQVPHLDILTRMFRFQLLRSEEHGDYEVRLPRVHGGARWRMLQVSNFSHLAFKRNSYRIKATNIMVAMKEAQKTGKTAILLNEYIRKNYGSMIFGVYACCFQLNKVFIGPYGMDEDHDLETLRFVNNVLVNTDVVDKMRNAGGQSTNGCWFVQVVLKKKKNTDQPAEAPAAVTHKMNESEYALLSTFDAAATMFTDTLKSLMTAARLRLPHSAVPLALKANFDDGFIHAFKYPGHDAIFVYWPGGRIDEPQKFDTKDVALEWVVGNLMKTFVAVPNFTITAKFVKVSDFVENSTCSTMSRNYFDELHIVGPFGAVRMVKVADYLIHPEKEHPPELVDVITEFCLGSDGLSKTDFLESMLVQTKADVSVELTKSSKLGDEKRNLEKKRNDLLLKIKALKPALKSNPVVSSEVICLDSDDETPTEAPKTTVIPQSPTKSFTKLSDALQQTSDPVKLRNNVVLYQMKGGAQLTRKTYPSPASKPRKMPTIKSVRPMQPFAEKIDLSHLDPAKVQRLLGSTDLTSGRVLLTGEQLRNLRALSKVKVVETPTTTETTPKVKTTETATTESNT